MALNEVKSRLMREIEKAKIKLSIIEFYEKLGVKALNDHPLGSETYILDVEPAKLPEILTTLKDVVETWNKIYNEVFELKIIYYNNGTARIILPRPW